MQYIFQFNNMALLSAGKAFVICLHRIIGKASGMPHGWLRASPWSESPDSRRLLRAGANSDLIHRVLHLLAVMLVVDDISDTHERINFGNNAVRKKIINHG